jgi:hypothetical protein
VKKYFLLTAGERYYPCSGDSDWKQTYETYAEAEAAAKTKNYDWYRIIDLRDWIGGGDDE